MDAEAKSSALTTKRRKTGGGHAFHSRLEPFAEFIREQRRRRRTWKEIAEALHAEKSCLITFQGVHQFYRRYLKLSTRPHWERQPAAGQMEISAKRISQASVPPERPFRQPPPDSIQLNDPNNV